MSEITPLVLNRVDRFADGIELLRASADEIEICPIPNSFPNGAPDFSHRAYVCLHIHPEGEPSPAVRARLAELGWREEQEGEFWIFE